MDLDDFRTVLETAGVDVWTFIDTAILVASLDHGEELKQRRDGIVERLYATSMVTKCKSCDFGERSNGFQVNSNNDESNSNPHEEGKAGERVKGSPFSPQSDNEADDFDPYGGLFDDEQKRVIGIKERLELPNQSEDTLVDLLQTLADMDITFQALKETDIGRHVNKLRKHSSNDVKRLVKQLVRKWKEIVDEWVRVNQPGEPEPAALMDGDSPQRKLPQNGRQQVPDFTYSPNPHNGGSGSEKNYSEPERKPKPKPISSQRKDPPLRPSHLTPPQNVQRQRDQKENNFDSERLASARKRLQESYKEAENAKKQRTIQVMDIHELPKPKNAFYAKNKGGGSQGRHW
ncbi:putative mediator of RNA polymerase II transcription subunit 26c [Hibiscus syriacus]|uniref:Mediator of RNA polymerase II transcription subunit 26c n=1 Tax=Hibiscus syriacus TaxID=106335 RepID=A0A6A2ZC43_HIBSY|nr:probable mediator of RNA polymerase II transcription subunit 26c isoform X1 [Hibiscus syriacus]KAE8689544.1 putative mediator of RNA polymerase II transcription subunit 26c [Hibiscus syriacus]